MKLFLYANLNVVAGFFGSFITERIEPDEIVKDYAQLICSLPKEDLLKLKECDLYCFGSFDNVTGEIVPEKTFLLHCADFASKFLAEKEGVDDERK